METAAGIFAHRRHASCRDALSCHLQPRPAMPCALDRPRGKGGTMTDQAGRRVTERFTPQNVHFVCEQDGAPERELKDRLATTLRSMGVKKAYLAVVSYDDRKGPHTTAGNHSTAE